MQSEKAIGTDTSAAHERRPVCHLVRQRRLSASVALHFSFGHQSAHRGHRARHDLRQYARLHLPVYWLPGILFSSKALLRVAIVLYGFRLTFRISCSSVSTGWRSVPSC